MTGHAEASSVAILAAVVLSLTVAAIATGLSAGQRPSSPPLDEKNLSAMRTAMVEQQIVERGVSDHSVIEAMLTIPVIDPFPRTSLRRRTAICHCPSVAARPYHSHIS